MPQFTEVKHPLIQDKLSRMRDKTAGTEMFRRGAEEIAFMLGYEALRTLPMREDIVETPLKAFVAPVLEKQQATLISILRAGNGMLSGLIDLLPDARVGFVGLARNEETLKAEQYYAKTPSDMSQDLVLVCDPMLATGGSAADTLDLLKAEGAKNLLFICLLAAPEGVAAFHKRHPDVAIFTAALDEHLNDVGYIVPGLGDAGDRIFGTL